MAAPKIAYGFIGLQHLFNERVSTVGTQMVYDAVQQSAAEHSRVISELMGAFVEPTTLAQEQIELATSGVLQPVDEWGAPKPRKHSGSYQVAYPIRGGADAWGSSRVAGALMTVEEVNRQMIGIQNADANWNRLHIMAALLDNTTWTFCDRAVGSYKGLGNITIQPLANGDTVEYVRKTGVTAVDDHFLAQAGAIADLANPFPTIYDELMEHPSNAGGDVIVYVPTNLKATIKALGNFLPYDDPNVVYGNASDRLARMVDRGFGDKVLGYCDECWIVEWSQLPSNYMIAHATGGGPVLKMREYDAPELQGLFPEEQPDGSMGMFRYNGFGVSNRVGALVYRIGNAAYAIPSGYTNPIQLG